MVMTLLEFPGLTIEQYEAAGAKLPPEAPAGIQYHACEPVDGGWCIIGIWESRETFDRFIDEYYLPAMRRTGGPEPFRREVFPAHHAGAVQRDVAARDGQG